jgi:serine/threonine-protein kinase
MLLMLWRNQNSYKMDGKIIQFIRSKDYRFIKEIGQGGTGRTVLLEDEIINERFVCKKYSPFHIEHKKMFFDNFKEEIKVLHKLYHSNIVRVFNYYLYPDDFTGYILMEFIEGHNIDLFLKNNPDKLNDIFKQVIDGFVNLELCKILHRDIRPDNILISNDGLLKIIDFGFSKITDLDTDYNKSISLNWRYNPPKDFEKNIYDYKTEIYFVGKLFEEIITENNFQDFLYKDILKIMTKIDYDDRIDSFFEINRKLISENTFEINFTTVEKYIYQNFADSLINILSKIEYKAEYNTDVKIILTKLHDVYRNSLLEDNIQSVNLVAKCFLKGNFSYYKTQEFKVNTLHEFWKFLNLSSKEAQKIILNNLWQRLDNILRESPKSDDDLPF